MVEPQRSGTQGNDVVSRPFFMTEIQYLKLKSYLQKPIQYFDIIINDYKKGDVWKYFGELAYKDTVSGDIHVIDTNRVYCLVCIQSTQRQDPSTSFERSAICFFTKNTAGNNYLDHLRIRHQISVGSDRRNGHQAPIVNPMTVPIAIQLIPIQVPASISLSAPATVISSATAEASKEPQVATEEDDGESLNESPVVDIESSEQNSTKDV